MAKVRKIADEISLLNIQESSYRNSQNKKQPCLLLDKKACLLMVASETPKVLQAISQAGALFILPAGLVGSGLKRIGYENLVPNNLFSRLY